MMFPSTTQAACLDAELVLGTEWLARIFARQKPRPYANDAPSKQPMSEPERTAGAELLAGVRARDPQAFRKLSALYLRSTVNFAYRVLRDQSEAEDIAQETFLRVWRKANSYEQGSAKGWILRIAHNLCIDRLRKRRELLNDAEEEAPVSAVTPSRLLARKRNADRVNLALGALPARQRVALSLVFFEGLSGPEAAEVMGLGVRAVESLLARGRKNLKRLLEHDGASESPRQPPAPGTDSTPDLGDSE